MFDLIKKFYFLHNIILINIYLNYVLCSLNDFQEIELLKLTSVQQMNLNLMFQDLKPKFILSTYLIDPINTNTCYIFVENTCTNEIKHYSIFLDNKQSLNSIKDIILNEGLSINNIYDLSFKDIFNIHFEILMYKNLSIKYNMNNFNKFIKRIFNNFSTLFLRFDSSFIIKFNIYTAYFKKPNKINDLISQNLINFLKLGYNIRTIKNSNKCINFENFKKSKTLDDYILHKISKLNNFFMLNLDSKFDHIHSIANCTYYFSLHHEIHIVDIIENILEKINSTVNKLDKLTFVLCFIKIYGDILNFHSRLRLIKLYIIINLYQQSLEYDLNNYEILTLLYMISKKRLLKNENNIIGFEICILNKRNEDTMKIIIIRRYSYFTLFYPYEFLSVLNNLLSFSKYFNIIWLIVKCFIITIYNMFDIDIN